MPFVVIICVGIIVVLGYNLWKNIFGDNTLGDAQLFIDSGSVQVKMWNSESFVTLSSKALVMEGDEIKTSGDAKVMLEFFDGTLVRLDGNTNIVLSIVDDDVDSPEVELMLVEGKMWINKLYKNTADTKVSVAMADVVVKSELGTIFEVENTMDEAVRIFHGDDLIVDILSSDGGKVVETETLGVGQEIVFSQQVLEKYWEYQSPNVVNALSDEFKTSSWFLWNTEKDKSANEASDVTDNGLVPVIPETFSSTSSSSSGILTDTSTNSDTSNGEIIQTESSLGTLVKPTIDSVSGIKNVDANGFYEVSTNPAILTGSVSGASQVVVNGYTLQKFKEGDKAWTYFANASYQLMNVGENIYTVYAIGPNGEKSDAIIVKVNYKPPVQNPVPVVTPSTVAVPSTTSSTPSV
jgi:hypothetical protein